MVRVSKGEGDVENRALRPLEQGGSRREPRLCDKGFVADPARCKTALERTNADADEVRRLLDARIFVSA